MRRIYLLILIGMFLVTTVSALSFDEAEKKLNQIGNEIEMEDELCHSVKYKIISNFFNDFVINIKSDINFQININIEGCEAKINLEDSLSNNPDITANFYEKDKEIELKSHSLRGLIFKKIIKEEINNIHN